MSASEWHSDPMADPSIRKVTDAFTTLWHVRQYLRSNMIEMHTHEPCAPSTTRRMACPIIALACSSLGTSRDTHGPRMSHILLVPGLRLSRSVPWHSGHSGRSTANRAWAFWLFDAPLCPGCPPRALTATTSAPSSPPPLPSSPPPLPSSPPPLPQSNASATTALYFARVLFLSDLSRGGVFSFSCRRSWPRSDLTRPDSSPPDPPPLPPPPPPPPDPPPPGAAPAGSAAGSAPVPASAATALPAPDGLAGFARAVCTASSGEDRMSLTYAPEDAAPGSPASDPLLTFTSIHA